MPKGYVCVYRHYFPRRSDLQATKLAAQGDPQLLRFIADYEKGKSYFDWGDDPSFFSALRFQGDVRCAGWGVCRPNVRNLLNPTESDFVVFFCAKRPDRHVRLCEYYFIGVGTVAECIDRKALWARSQYSDYRNHYNVLAIVRGKRTEQKETFYPYHHKNWKERLKAPYVIFDPERSRFNLSRPLHVATYTGGKAESWHSGSSRRIAKLEYLLFRDRNISRRLRTSPTGFSHPHINLSARRSRAGLPEEILRKKLLSLV